MKNLMIAILSVLLLGTWIVGGVGYGRLSQAIYEMDTRLETSENRAKEDAVKTQKTNRELMETIDESTKIQNELNTMLPLMGKEHHQLKKDVRLLFKTTDYVLDDLHKLQEDVKKLKSSK